MRLALLGAFPFPSPQGSQVYFGAQARALRDCGLEPELITYGSGAGETDADLACTRSPRLLSPRSLRSGPSLQKLPADAALCATYLRSHRRRPFDVALAHNVEAAAVALAARPWIGVPVIYVVHTLLGRELSAYAPAALAPGCDALGRGIDAALARRADGILALCEAAVAFARPIARGPVARIPPGLDPAPAPAPEAISRACARLGLEPGRFALYAGNLDGYQDLELLLEAARRLRAAPARAHRAPLRLVIATHQLGRGAAGLRRVPGLECVEVASFAELRALCFAAQSAVLPRQRTGGFPIKLLNYMEAGLPIVAFEDVAEGLADGESAWLLRAGAGARELAHALESLDARPEHAASLGSGARRVLEARHGWTRLAARTRALAEQVAGPGALACGEPA